MIIVHQSPLPLVPRNVKRRRGRRMDCGRARHSPRLATPGTFLNCQGTSIGSSRRLLQWGASATLAWSLPLLKKRLSPGLCGAGVPPALLSAQAFGQPGRPHHDRPQTQPRAQNVRAAIGPSTNRVEKRRRPREAHSNCRSATSTSLFRAAGSLCHTVRARTQSVMGNRKRFSNGTVDSTERLAGGE